MKAWRISNYADLSGVGGRYSAGRWNQLGQLIVYCADHPALALLEILVHVDAADLPENYQLLEISIPDESIAEPAELPLDWASDFAVSRNAFENFCLAVDAPVLKVPSAIVPHCSNLLINPAHPKAGAITILSALRQPFYARYYDKRFQ